eukprot:6230086-Prymnesium_polylepis.1
MRAHGDRPGGGERVARMLQVSDCARTTHATSRQHRQGPLTSPCRPVQSARTLPGPKRMPWAARRGGRGVSWWWRARRLHHMRKLVAHSGFRRIHKPSQMGGSCYSMEIPVR